MVSCGQLNGVVARLDVSTRQSGMQHVTLVNECGYAVLEFDHVPRMLGLGRVSNIKLDEHNMTFIAFMVACVFRT